MIVKRKLRKFPPEQLPLSEKGKSLTRISADEFMIQTYDFLKTFYRGCFDAYRIQVGYKTLLVCIENFAIVIKELVKAVFGRELIIIRFESDRDRLFIKLEFNTSVLSEELRSKVKTLSNEGGFDIIFSESSVSIELEYLIGAAAYVNSNSTRIVYNMLVYVFESKKF